MRREEGKELLPIIQAWAEGKSIQHQTDSKSWSDITKDLYPCNHPAVYRIKPEQKYRPFKTKEGCWQEMLKHQPFGFIINKYSNDYCGVCRVFKDEKGISRITFISNPYSDLDMEIVFDRFNFADGTPFGINEK